MAFLYVYNATRNGVKSHGVALRTCCMHSRRAIRQTQTLLLRESKRKRISEERVFGSKGKASYDCVKREHVIEPTWLAYLVN
jgi:hypothetical protein